MIMSGALSCDIAKWQLCRHHKYKVKYVIYHFGFAVIKMNVSQKCPTYTEFLTASLIQTYNLTSMEVKPLSILFCFVVAVVCFSICLFVCLKICLCTNITDSNFHMPVNMVLAEPFAVFKLHVKTDKTEDATFHMCSIYRINKIVRTVYIKHIYNVKQDFNVLLPPIIPSVHLHACGTVCVSVATTAPRTGSNSASFLPTNLTTGCQGISH